MIPYWVLEDYTISLIFELCPSLNIHKGTCDGCNEFTIFVSFSMKQGFRQLQRLDIPYFRYKIVLFIYLWVGVGLPQTDKYEGMKPTADKIVVWNIDLAG